MPGRGKAWRFLLMALLLAFGGTFQDAEARQDLWLTRAHDARRTGQSLNDGPMSIDPAQSWMAETPGAHTLNIGASVTERGVFFGSWGLLRRIPGNPDPRLWDGADDAGRRVVGGVYFARLLAADAAGQAYVVVRKVVVLR